MHQGQVSCPRCHESFHSGHDSAVRCPKCGASFDELIQQSTPRSAPTVEWHASPDSDRVEAGPTPPQIGRYLVKGVLGAGGFGAVYLARDPELDRDVAIKVPHQNRLQGEEQIEQFLKEARIAARLSHPNLVTIYDVGRTGDGRPFVAMAYLSGQSLRAVLRTKTFSLSETIELLASVADVVNYIHQNGLMHCDLKPENILVEPSGAVKVADFGMAIHEDTQSQFAGRVAGTPAYMSPEQARGDLHLIDGRADIWALGVILYELLTRRLPFHGTREQIVDQILHREPKPPRQIRGDIPPALESICLRCLSKEITERFTTAGDLARDLRAGRENGSRARGPVVKRRSAGAKGKAKRQVAILAAVFVFIMLGLLIVALERGSFGTDSTNRATGAKPTIAKKFEPNRWHELFAQEGARVFWPSWDPTARSDFDLVGRRVWIDSKSPAAFQLGHVHADYFRLEVSLAKSSSSGDAGLFWGLEETPLLQGERMLRFHAILLQHWKKAPPDQRTTLCRLNLDVRVKREGTISVSSQTVAQVPIKTVVEAQRDSILDVRVAGGRVAEVRWQGQPIRDLDDLRQTIREGDRPHQGGFGIFNQQGATTFSDARLMILAESVNADSE